MLKRILDKYKGNKPQYPVPGWPNARGYDLHLPRLADKSQPLPVVFAVHGYTHDGGLMAGLTAPDGDANHLESLNSLADEQGFAVVYPYGTRIGILPGRCWNAGGGMNGYAPVGDPAVRNDVDDVQFFLDVLKELENRFSVDLTRLYLAGISNGGAMVQRLAMSLPELWAAVATVAGCNQYAGATGEKPQTPTPILHIHGVEDRIWPYKGGEMAPFGLMESVESSVAAWVECNNAELVSEEALRPAYPDELARVTLRRYEGEKEVELYTIIGGGHVWPSGHQYLPEKVIGEVTRQLNTNRLLWSFFSRHGG